MYEFMEKKGMIHGDPKPCLRTVDGRPIPLTTPVSSVCSEVIICHRLGVQDEQCKHNILV